METKENLDEINHILKELENIHLSAGLLREKVNCCKALIDLENDEMDVIYNLTESHSAGLRNKTVYRYEKLLANDSNCVQNTSKLELSKDVLAIKCSTVPKEKKIKEMLRQIEEMPKEWTVIQLTPQYNPMELWNEDKDVYYTNPIHISVFNCSTKEKPFFVTVNAPKDPVTGEKVELCKEIIFILKRNHEVLTSHGQSMFKNHKEKFAYFENVHSVEDRFQSLIKDTQKLWLKEWRCLLTGKFCDEKVESQIREDLINGLKAELTDLKLTKKVETILCCAIKSYVHLTLNETKNIVQQCFPEIKDKNIIRIITTITRTIGEKVFMQNEKTRRHPVILILHDSLDFFPWEMIDVLEDQPVCRLPSLHFLYCLFKEHEKDIENGYKIINDYDKGVYIVNPGTDLKAMEIRMMSFFNYWTPNWTGVCGYKPSKDEFFELLTSSNIFSYNGHGSGSSLLSIDKLQKSHVKAVVLLFGCGSTRIIRKDPQADMFGHYYMYLIARCPCVVGMLWEVTDRSTDILSTYFMSYWIPSNAPKHWKYVDKQKWQKNGETITFMKNQPAYIDDQTWEPDLLQALILAKKKLSSVMTKAACVTRGLPVKLKTRPESTSTEMK